MDAASKKQCVYMESIDDLVVSSDWKGLVTCTAARACSIPRYKMVNEESNNEIHNCCMSFSNGVLYVLAVYGQIFSLHIETLTLRKIAISGIDLTTFHWRYYGLLCHNENIYIAHQDSRQFHIYKCAMEDSSSLRVSNSNSYPPQNMIHLPLSPLCSWPKALAIKDGKIYCTTTIFNITIFDSDTLALISNIAIEGHVPNGIVIPDDDNLHLATGNGVHIYTTDGAYVQSYLDEVYCRSIACTNSGYILVMTEQIEHLDKIAVFKFQCGSLTPRPVAYITTTSAKYFDIGCTCSPGNSLVMVTNDNQVAIVPQEAIFPPFLLQTLCMSFVSNHPEILLANCLPPALYRQSTKLHFNVSYKQCLS